MSVTPVTLALKLTELNEKDQQRIQHAVDLLENLRATVLRSYDIMRNTIDSQKEELTRRQEIICDLQARLYESESNEAKMKESLAAMDLLVTTFQDTVAEMEETDVILREELVRVNSVPVGFGNAVLDVVSCQIHFDVEKLKVLIEEAKNAMTEK
jgi:hypothetical protein